MYRRVRGHGQLSNNNKKIWMPRQLYFIFICINAQFLWSWEIMYACLFEGVSEWSAHRETGDQLSLTNRKLDLRTSDSVVIKAADNCKAVQMGYIPISTTCIYLSPQMKHLSLPFTFQRIWQTLIPSDCRMDHVHWSPNLGVEQTLTTGSSKWDLLASMILYTVSKHSWKTNNHPGH